MDWQTWKDKSELEPEMEDFDLEKMVELMKRNGDWDENEDFQEPPEEDPTAEGSPDQPDERQSDDSGKGKPELTGDQLMFEQFMQ